MKTISLHIKFILFFIKKIKHPIFFLFLIFYILPISFFARNDNPNLENVKLQLKYFHGFQFAGYYAADLMGYYKDEGLSVNFIEADINKDVVYSVISGKSEYGIAGASDLITSKMNGKPLVMLKAIFQHTPLTLISLKKNNLEKPSDFVNKVIMIGNDINSVEIKAMFRNVGIKREEIIYARHTWNFDDLFNTKIDAIAAYVTDQPYHYRQKGFKINLLQPAEYGIDFYGDALFTSEKEVEENPERVEKFIRASLKGWKYALENSHELVDYILLLPNVAERNITKDALLFEAEETKKLIHIVEIGHINPYRIEKIAKTYLEFGLAEANYSLDNFIYSPKTKFLGFEYTLLSWILGALISLILFAFLFIVLLKKSVKNKTQELQKSEAKSLAVLEAIPDIMFRVTKDGNYIDYHAPSDSYLAMPEERVIGRNINDTLPPEIVTKANEAIQDTLNKNRLNIIEYRMSHNDIEIDFEARISPAGPNEVLVIARDITETKKQKELIEINETKYRKLFETASDAIFLMSDGKFIDCNKKTLEIYACTREQIINKTPYDFSPEYQYSNQSSVELANEKISQCLKGIPQFFEWRHKRFDGTEFDAEVHLSQLSYLDKNYILAIVRDITETKRTTDLLKESEAKYKDLVNSFHDIVFITDYNSKMLFANPALERQTGLTIKDFQFPREDNPFVHSEDLENVNNFVVNFIESDKIHSDIIENRFNDVNGNASWYSSVMSKIKYNEEPAIQTISRNITEVKKQRDLIKESEEKFSRIFKSSPTAVSMYVLESGEIVDVNFEYERIMGYNYNELIGKTTLELNIWENNADRETYVETLKTKGFVRSLTIYFRRKNGELFPTLFSSELIVLKNKKYIISNFIDISDAKEKEKNLQHALSEIKVLKSKLETENIYLQEEIKLEHNFGKIITKSKKYKDVLSQIEQVAPTDSTVLILGETGTGKELFARSVHNISNRANSPLVKVNCASLPENLIESELFGHEKGAFTGAVKQKIGRFEFADGGTIFLDEIGELPLELQAKLLRVLQENEFERLGSTETIKTDVRIIAATNRDLKKFVAEGKFREDLFFRLNVFPIHSIPLRDRKEDISLLVNHFVKELNSKLGKDINQIPQTTMDELQSYSWPGNVRELENIIERAIILSKDEILMIEELQNNLSIQSKDSSPQLSLKEMEYEKIQEALKSSNWKIEGNNGAAKLLDVAPSTLRDKIKKYGLQKP